MKVEKIAIKDLKLWEDNPRGIEKGDYANLKKRLTEKGQFKPLLVDQDNTVLGGNMRLRAMRDLGWEDAYVVRVAPKNAAERLWYALVDNEMSGYYEDQKLAELTIDLPELDDIKVDLGKGIELGDLKDRFRPVEEDEVPPVPEGEPESKLGEVYELGRHRLMCGDSTKREDVEKLMGGKRADMVFTDAPYEIETKGGGILKNATQMLEIEKNCVNHFNPKVLECYAKTSIFFHNKNLIKKYIELSEKWDANYDLAIYKKPGLPNYNNHLMTDIEYIAIIGKLDPKKGLSMFDYSKVFEGRKDVDNKLSYSKPIEICDKFIKLYSSKDESVLDLFGGSGSTLIACEQLDRTCYMMEIDPRYCDVIRRRYANYKEKEKNN
ncbi:MAG: DNA modification methylase [Candidatus Moranbacteria bacterium]|nr:DNA modification methylase [Candidatus Moranbacteria bacterium]